MGYEEAKQRGRAAMALLAECCKQDDEKGATDLLHDTFPLLHVVYQAEVVRFLLKPTPGHEDFAKRVFGNVQHLGVRCDFEASRRQMDALRSRT